MGQPLPMTVSHDKSLQMICHALRNRQVIDFVHASVRTGYLEFFLTQGEHVNTMLDEAFDRLARSQSDAIDPKKLGEATSLFVLVQSGVSRVQDTDKAGSRFPASEATDSRNKRA